MLNQVARPEDLRDYDVVEPRSRDLLLAEWRDDPNIVLEQAREANVPLNTYSNMRAPATPESPGSTVEWLLYNLGFRMVDTLTVPSTRGSSLPRTHVDEGDPPCPTGRLLNAYWDECYVRTLLTGYRSAASVANLTVGSVWRTRYEEGPVRSPQVDSGVNFMDLVAFARNITEETYRVSQWNNAMSEQTMQVLTEGTEPMLFELTRSSEETQLDNFRAGIEATDSYLTGSQTRASDITNAVEEIAIIHRLILSRRVAKLIHDNLPSGNTYDTAAAANRTIAGVTHQQNTLLYPHWKAFKKTFGNAYTGDTVIGNEKSITDLELMSVTGGTNLSFGSFAMVPNSNVRNLNEDDLSLAYGWIDGVSELENSELTVYQRATTAAFVSRMGMDQDEVERVAGPRRTRRWLGAQSAFAIVDPRGIRVIDYSNS